MSIDRSLLSKSSPSLSNIVRRSTTSDLSDRQLRSVSSSELQRYKEDYLKFEYKPTPFNARWIYGYNQKVPPINLNKYSQTLIFYAASNCGVVYDWRANEMKLLQGHSNMVSCIATDATARWLVTADSGPGNIIVVWDSGDFLPKRTLFNPHGNYQLSDLALSADAKYLLTLAYEKKPTLNWWIWSYGHELPNATITMDVPTCAILNIYFNPVNTEQFFILTKKDVWIGSCMKVEAGDFIKEERKYELKLSLPVMKGCSDAGKLTSLTYVAKSCQLLVSNNRGAVLIFGYTTNFVEIVDGCNMDTLRFVKMLKLEMARINVISTWDDVIVTGNDQGELKFYDLQLRLLYWCQGFKVNSIKEISCNVMERNYTIIDSDALAQGSQTLPRKENVEAVRNTQKDSAQQLLSTKIPTDATVLKKPFLIRDFILSSEDEGIGYVDLIKGQYTLIQEHRGCNVSALTVHDEKVLVCVAYENGEIVLYHYITHNRAVTKDLRKHFRVKQPPKLDSVDSVHSGQNEFVPNIYATCLQYSPSGLHLACALDNGELLFLDPTTLDIKTQKVLKDTTDAVRQICFSQNSSTLAYADARRKICVYSYDCSKQEWQFIATHRAHYKNITSLLFTSVKNEDGFYKLFSFGEDRIMVEYDIGLSNEQLDVVSMDRIEQSAVPLCVVEWPTPSDVQSDIPALLLANDQHKYKIINADTTMTLTTVLGPLYETPVRKIKLITKHGNSPDYIIFATHKLIGIQKLPLDGNPYKHIGMLGHPREITGMCFREDSNTLFTIGAADSCLHQWTAKYRSVDTTTKLGGIELHPYYCLLEGGREGKLFQEMVNLFYYIQILCQGTFSPAVRRVSYHIPVDSLPDFMRALGFFPSEYEVENLLAEAQYNIYRNEPKRDIGFEDSVKLYLNHRQSFGESFDNLLANFSMFSTFNSEIGDFVMPRTELVEVLTNHGEHFSNERALYILKILTGQKMNDDQMKEAGTDEWSFLSVEISYKEFVGNFLGVEGVEDILKETSEVCNVSKESSTTAHQHH